MRRQDEETASRAGQVLAALPRFHPSFAFEEDLAGRLRRLADGLPLNAELQPLAEIIAFPNLPRHAGAIDRRLLVGGAIVGGALASGVSVAALVAWWQVGRRSRSQVVA
jgi:hypothetical protein